jgi:glutamine amidotransferase
MGWNEVAFPAAGEPLGRDLPDRHFYFVHSYRCVPGPGVQVIAEADHGGRFCAGVRRGNVAAVQFHPEKSGPAGLALLRNFLTAT